MSKTVQLSDRDMEVLAMVFEVWDSDGAKTHAGFSWACVDKVVEKLGLARPPFLGSIMDGYFEKRAEQLAGGHNEKQG